MKKIKLAIDVDDCVCNTVEMDFACAYYLNKQTKNLNKDFDNTYFDVTKTFDMTKEEGDNFYRKEKQFIMKNNDCMYPKVFVRKVLEKLKQKGFEIYFVSGRDDSHWNNNSTKYLKKWLKTYKIPFNGVYSNVQNKNELCKKLEIDYLIEDRIDYTEKANNDNIKTILIKQSYNKEYSHNLNQFAENWLDLYCLLGEIYNFKTDDLISF